MTRPWWWNFGDFMFSEGFVFASAGVVFLDSPLLRLGLMIALFVWTSFWSGWAAGEKEGER